MMFRDSFADNYFACVLVRGLCMAGGAVSFLCIPQVFQSGLTLGHENPSGCSRVLNSRWARIGSLPLGILGLIFYVACFSVAGMVKHPAWGVSYTWLVMPATIAGGEAAVLTLLQFLAVRRTCWLCVVAQVIGCAISVVVFVGARSNGCLAECLPEMALAVACIACLTLLQMFL